VNVEIIAFIQIINLEKRIGRMNVEKILMISY